MRSGSTEEHWQAVYGKSKPDQVGWFQQEHKVSVDLILSSGVSKQARILDVGSGATTLLDALVELGYSNVIATDISEEGLAHSQRRLGDSVEWVVDDLTRSTKLLEMEQIDLWHDRAVLHFFTSEEERNGYRDVLMGLLKVGGFAAIETFSTEGAPQCSGLDLHRYDEQMLQDFLGLNFELLHSLRHIHITPGGGERPYVSTLFKRLS